MLLNLELTEARHAFEEGGLVAAAQATQNGFVPSATPPRPCSRTPRGRIWSLENLVPKCFRIVYGVSCTTHFSGRLANVSGANRAMVALSSSSAAAPWHFWFPQPAHLWVIVLIVLLCYLLARYVTSPVRNLRSAMDRFGRGDLTARAEAKRHDELGDLGASFNGMAAHIQTLLAAERRLLFGYFPRIAKPSGPPERRRGTGAHQ